MTTNKDNLMNELKDLLSKYNLDSLNESKERALLDILDQRCTDSNESSKKKIMSSKSLLAMLNDVEVEDGYFFYAIVGENGYALLRNADNCQNQLNYYKNCEYRGFEYADDAMDWIREKFPTKSHIRNHNVCSLEYMLKYENFWLRRGKVEDI